MRNDAAHRILQISDIHLTADVQGELLGVKTYESLQAVINQLKHNNNKFDLIILSGDLSQDGSSVSYIRLAELINTLNVPVYFVPGNHDDEYVMNSVYPQGNITNKRHIILGNWQVILLNSQKPGSVEGRLDVTQLDFLKSCLEKYPDHRAIVMLHHHPLKVGSAWLDKLCVSNADAFWQTIAHYPFIEAVFFGHVHQEFSQTMNKIKCYGVPSTCIQFQCNQDYFGLAELPPGYRYINLYEDGRLETKIERLPEYIGYFDSEAKGY